MKYPHRKKLAALHNKRGYSERIVIVNKTSDKNDRVKCRRVDES